MIEKWIHLQELGGDPWILAIWNAANSAAAQGKIRPITKAIYELGPSLSIKLNMIPKLIQRINQETDELFAKVKHYTSENVFSFNKNGFVFEVDNNLKYLLAADIDAFLYELQSSLELMEILFLKIFRHLGRKITVDVARDEMRSANLAEGFDTHWLDILKDHRNFIAHRGACYLAIDITDNHNFGLLIMKEILQNFSDSTKYLTGEDLANIAQGFMNNKVTLRKLLIRILIA